MNGATAWNPAPARAGSRCRQVQAASGNPCRHSASGPDPASSTQNSRPFARTAADRTATEAATASSYPYQHSPDRSDANATLPAADPSVAGSSADVDDINGAAATTRET